MDEFELDTYDPILYMRTLGLLDNEVSISSYEGFIDKMEKKLSTVDNKIAEYVEKNIGAFIRISDQIGALDRLVGDLQVTEERFTDYIDSGLDKNEELYFRLR
jgi:hypothetical protein